MSSTSDACDPVFLGVVFTVFGLGAVGSFAWGTWGTTMWTLRDGIASLFIYCAYIYAQWPEVWMCVGAMTAVAYQLVVGVFLGLVLVTVLFCSILACSYRKALQNAVAKAKLARESQINDTEGEELLVKQ